MAKFRLNAEIRLRVANLSQVSGQVKNAFGKTKVESMISGQEQVKINKMSQALDGVTVSSGKAAKGAKNFGDAVFLAAKRYSAFVVATSAFFKLISAFTTGIGEALKFETEMIKVGQTTSQSTKSLGNLKDTITKLSIELGVSSLKLVETSRVLAQTGMVASDIKKIVGELAKTQLAPAFGSLEKTTEGVIAMRAQFSLSAKEIGEQLNYINVIAKNYAAESEDYIDAIIRLGGAFKASNAPMRDTGEQLRELYALFTSVRAVTRESPESIATGMRTIVGRLQRVKTVSMMKDLYDVDLRDKEGVFVGPYKAIMEIGKLIDSGKIKVGTQAFAQLMEQLGGVRQLKTVIPLFTQTKLAMEALNKMKLQSNSIDKDVARAQEGTLKQLQKLREEFMNLVRVITDSSAFKGLIFVFTNLSKALIGVAKSLEPIYPLLFGIAAFKMGNIGKQALVSAKHFVKVGYATGGQVQGFGNRDTVPAMLTPGEFVINAISSKKIGLGNLMKLNYFGEGGLVGRGTKDKLFNIVSPMFKAGEVSNFGSGGLVTSNRHSYGIGEPLSFTTQLNIVSKSFSKIDQPINNVIKNFKELALKVGMTEGEFKKLGITTGVAERARKGEVKALGKVEKAVQTISGRNIVQPQVQSQANVVQIITEVEGEDEKLKKKGKRKPLPISDIDQKVPIETLESKAQKTKAQKTKASYTAMVAKRVRQNRAIAKLAATKAVDEPTLKQVQVGSVGLGNILPPSKVAKVKVEGAVPKKGSFGNIDPNTLKQILAEAELSSRTFVNPGKRQGAALSTFGALNQPGSNLQDVISQNLPKDVTHLGSGMHATALGSLSQQTAYRLDKHPEGGGIQRLQVPNMLQAIETKKFKRKSQAKSTFTLEKLPLKENLQGLVDNRKISLAKAQRIENELIERQTDIGINSTDLVMGNVGLTPDKDYKKSSVARLLKYSTVVDPGALSLNPIREKTFKEHEKLFGGEIEELSKGKSEDELRKLRREMSGKHSDVKNQRQTLLSQLPGVPTESQQGELTSLFQEQEKLAKQRDIAVLALRKKLGIKFDDDIDIKKVPSGRSEDEYRKLKPGYTPNIPVGHFGGMKPPIKPPVITGFPEDEPFRKAKVASQFFGDITKPSSKQTLLSPSVKKSLPTSMPYVRPTPSTKPIRGNKGRFISPITPFVSASSQPYLTKRYRDKRPTLYQPKTPLVQISSQLGLPKPVRKPLPPPSLSPFKPEPLFQVSTQPGLPRTRQPLPPPSVSPFQPQPPLIQISTQPSLRKPTKKPLPIKESRTPSMFYSGGRPILSGQKLTPKIDVEDIGRQPYSKKQMVYGSPVSVPKDVREFAIEEQRQIKPQQIVLGGKTQPSVSKAAKAAKDAAKRQLRVIKAAERGLDNNTLFMERFSKSVNLQTADFNALMAPIKEIEQSSKRGGWTTRVLGAVKRKKVPVVEPVAIPLGQGLFPEVPLAPSQYTGLGKSRQRLQPISFMERVGEITGKAKGGLGRGIDKVGAGIVKVDRALGRAWDLGKVPPPPPTPPPSDIGIAGPPPPTPPPPSGPQPGRGLLGRHFGDTGKGIVKGVVGKIGRVAGSPMGLSVAAYALGTETAQKTVGKRTSATLSTGLGAAGLVGMVGGGPMTMGIAGVTVALGTLAETVDDEADAIRTKSMAKAMQKFNVQTDKLSRVALGAFGQGFKEIERSRTKLIAGTKPGPRGTESSKTLYRGTLELFKGIFTEDDYSIKRAKARAVTSIAKEQQQKTKDLMVEQTPAFDEIKQGALNAGKTFEEFSKMDIGDGNIVNNFMKAMEEDTKGIKEQTKQAYELAQKMSGYGDGIATASEAIKKSAKIESGAKRLQSFVEMNKVSVGATDAFSQGKGFEGLENLGTEAFSEAVSRLAIPKEMKKELAVINMIDAQLRETLSSITFDKSKPLAPQFDKAFGYRDENSRGPLFQSARKGLWDEYGDSPEEQPTKSGLMPTGEGTITNIFRKKYQDIVDKFETIVPEGDAGILTSRLKDPKENAKIFEDLQSVYIDMTESGKLTAKAQVELNKVYTERITQIHQQNLTVGQSKADLINAKSALAQRQAEFSGSKIPIGLGNQAILAQAKNMTQDVEGLRGTTNVNRLGAKLTNLQQSYDPNNPNVLQQKDIQNVRGALELLAQTSVRTAGHMERLGQVEKERGERIGIKEKFLGASPQERQGILSRGMVARKVAAMDMSPEQFREYGQKYGIEGQNTILQSAREFGMFRTPEKLNPKTGLMESQTLGEKANEWLEPTKGKFAGETGTEIAQLKEKILTIQKEGVDALAILLKNNQDALTQFSTNINGLMENSAKLLASLGTGAIPSEITIKHGDQNIHVIHNGLEVMKGIMPELRSYVERRTVEVVNGALREKLPTVGEYKPAATKEG